MKDDATDPADTSEYECLNCGKIVVATAHPGSCSACGTDLRNRGTALE